MTSVSDGDRSLEATPQPGVRRSIAALVLLCVVVLGLLFRNIGATVPYPRHPDEPFVSGPAQHTLKTGNWHPRDFNYPSLPKYLATAGMAVGFVRGAARGEVATTVRLHNFGFPYYDHPTIMETARQLYAVLAVIGVAATGLAAWLVVKRPAAMVFAPLLLIISPLYFADSWRYLNVDIVASCFATLTLASVLYASYRPSLVRSAVIPGALAGLATASKYTLAAAIVPVLLGTVLYLPRGRRLFAALAAGVSMVAAFLAVVPHSVLAFPLFLDGVATEAFHYASGHRGHQADPGLDQILFYGRHFVSDFGIAAPLALVGLAVLIRQDWRRALLLLACPAMLMWLLVGQRVQFERNVLSVHPILSICAAAGAGVLHDALLRLIAARRSGAPRGSQWLRWSTALLLALAIVPVWHVPDHLRDVTDSRKRGIEWIQQKLPAEWGVVVPSELGTDVRPLEATKRRVVSVKLQPALNTTALQQALAGIESPAVILVPRWGADPRYRGADVASTLNDLMSSWRVVARFGTQDVLVNYSYPNPRGDPAFAIAVYK